MLDCSASALRALNDALRRSWASESVARRSAERSRSWASSASARAARASARPPRARARVRAPRPEPPRRAEPAQARTEREQHGAGAESQPDQQPERESCVIRGSRAVRTERTGRIGCDGRRLTISPPRIVVHGRVQGVFFRDASASAPRQPGVAGWVRNRNDGRVEALFEGDPQAVEQVIEFARHGPDRAQVQHVESARRCRRCAAASRCAEDRPRRALSVLSSIAARGRRVGAR